MDYNGTSGNDILDQAQLGLADWSNIFGGAGNDTITIGVGRAQGGAGNDTITGTSSASTVMYGDSPTGVTVNLATGVVNDGFGTTDTLTSILVVAGTGYSDQFIGGSANEEFWGNGGNDTFVGGGGADTVIYWGFNFADVQTTYSAATDTITISNNSASGKPWTDTLTGISSISFLGAGTDSYLTKYDLITDFSPATNVSFTLSPGASVNAVKGGDFNGDGNMDIVLSQSVGAGTAPTQMLVFLGDGKGNFTDSTSTVFSAGAAIINSGGRTLIADFNNDGVSDIFQLGFGIDAPPFPGGTNYLFLSSPATHKLEDVSNTLTQTNAQNHAGSVGDVNGDGYLDILVNTLSLGNDLLINDGTGYFVSRPDLIPHPTVANSTTLQNNTYSGIVDVNNDGHADLILGEWDGEASTPTSQVLLNDGNGNFANSTPISLPSSGVYKEIILDVKAIDLNGDQLPDLMLDVTSGGDANTVTGLISDTYYRTPYIQLLINDGNGQFHDETSVRLPQDLAGNTDWLTSLTEVDFNHDGYADILATATTGGRIASTVYLNRGDGTFYEYWKSSVGAVTVAEDVNNDGMTDLVTANGSSISVSQNNLTNGHIYRANFGGDQLLGSSGNDSFYGNDGNDTLDGGTGTDVAAYTGNRANFTVTQSGTGYLVTDNTGANGTDTLANIERLSFADGSLGLDTSGTSGQMYRLYKAAFNRTPDAAGLGWNIDLVDGGMTMAQMSAAFVASAEFTSTYGSLTNTQFLDQLYLNVLGRPADAVGAAWNLNLLDTNAVDRPGMLAAYSESAENQAAVIGQIQDGIWFT